MTEELALSKAVNNLPGPADVPQAGQFFTDAQGWTWFVTRFEISQHYSGQMTARLDLERVYPTKGRVRAPKDGS